MLSLMSYGGSEVKGITRTMTTAKKHGALTPRKIGSEVEERKDSEGNVDYRGMIKTGLQQRQRVGSLAAPRLSSLQANSGSFN